MTSPTEQRRAFTRRIGLQDGQLQAAVPAPLYLPIPVWSRGTIAIAIAYASGLIRAGDYDRAQRVLDDPDLSADTQAASWRQFIAASLYHRTQRWPDLCTATDVCPVLVPR